MFTAEATRATDRQKARGSESWPVEPGAPEPERSPAAPLSAARGTGPGVQTGLACSAHSRDSHWMVVCVMLYSTANSPATASRTAWESVP